MVSNAISPLMYAVSGKSTLSAADGILIEAKVPDTCIMTTFDLEKGVRITVEAKVIEEGTYRPDLRPAGPEKGYPGVYQGAERARKRLPRRGASRLYRPAGVL